MLLVTAFWAKCLLRLATHREFCLIAAHVDTRRPCLFSQFEFIGTRLSRLPRIVPGLKRRHERGERR
jgi:hypothetical protein